MGRIRRVRDQRSVETAWLGDLHQKGDRERVGATDFGEGGDGGALLGVECGIVREHACVDHVAAGGEVVGQRDIGAARARDPGCREPRGCTREQPEHDPRPPSDPQLGAGPEPRAGHPVETARCMAKGNHTPLGSGRVRTLAREGCCPHLADGSTGSLGSVKMSR